MKYLEKHFWHYLVYAVIFCGGLSMLYFAKGNTRIEFLTFVAIACLYFMWGMLHNYVHHQLRLQIVMEYILVMILGSLLILFLFGV
jgi:hypothetical protein